MTSYVTYEDFERLQRQVKELEHASECTTSVPLPAAVSSLVGDFGSEIGEIAGVEEARYCMFDRCVNFYVVVKDLEAGLLRRIARVEIVLSRKYPSLSVDVAPVLSCEEIPDKCKIVPSK